MKMPLPAAIAFDLDGTLIDTAPDIASALNAALAGEGLPAASDAQVRGWIGDGPERLVRRALEVLDIPAHDDLVARLRDGFARATLAAPMDRGQVFDGIAALLDGLRAAGVPLRVVTNKPTALSREVLAAAGLLDRFDAVHGADRLEQRKPAPTLLLEVAAALGIAPERLLMVGDSSNDLRAARAAGCAVAWCDWGYGGAPPADAGDVLRVAHPNELAAAFA
jgi:phosphoglycolate phosphatase